MKNLKYYFEKARKEGWAIGQFNFCTLEQFHGIVEAAKNLNAPVILGTSEGESKFFGLEEAVALRNVLRKKTGWPIFLNLDHGKSLEYVKKAIDAGYDMAHFDGSKLTLEENIKIFKEVKKYAKWRGVLTEGEVGQIEFETKEENLTKADEAKKFAGEASADLLAVSIGNFHGSGAEKQESQLRLDRLSEIKKFLPRAVFVLHGGSSIREENIKEAIKMGVVKVNINTEIRMAFSENLRRALKNTEEITPYKYLQKPTESVKLIVEEKIKLFKSENKV